MQRPVRRDVTEYLAQTGQLAAVNSVNLTARVQGVLEAVDYSDGSFVKKGTSLFTIELPPYKAQLDDTKANLASNQAKAAFDTLQSNRTPPWRRP